VVSLALECISTVHISAGRVSPGPAWQLSGPGPGRPAPAGRAGSRAPGGEWVAMGRAVLASEPARHRGMRWTGMAPKPRRWAAANLARRPPRAPGRPRGGPPARGARATVRPGPIRPGPGLAPRTAGVTGSLARTQCRPARRRSTQPGASDVARSDSRSESTVVLVTSESIVLVP
jgi:hypothetical protein